MKRSIQGFRAMAAITALASGAAWAALGAQADTRPTLAVMSFSNGALGTAQTELAPLSAGIQDLLIDQLSGNAKVRGKRDDRPGFLRNSAPIGRG